MSIFNQMIEFLLASMEISVCYRISCDALLEKKYLQKKEKMFVYACTLIVSFLLFLNRKIVFISYSMLLLAIAITVIPFWAIKRKDCLSIVSIISACYLLLGLSEVFLAFMSMLVLKSNFNFLIYSYATSHWKNAIYFCVGIVFWCIYIYMKRIIEDINISVYKKMLMVFDIVLFVILIQYQRVLEGMSTGEQKMQGIAAGMTLLLLVGVFSFIVVLLLKYTSVQEENKYYMMRDEIYKHNSDEMNELLQMNRETVHNMKNHLWIMKKMGEEKEIERLKQYIDNLCQEFRDINDRLWTGNRVFDMVLSQKKVIAEQNAIKVDIQAMLLPQVKINDVEACALFGNILDNSIEACNKVKDEEKFINIKIEMKEELLFIKIENSIQEKPVIRKGELISSKEDKSIHGLGMKSVQRIVDKYEGTMTYQLKDESFVVMITFFDVLYNKW